MLLSLLALPVLVVGLPNIETKRANVHHLPLVRHTLHRRGDFVDLDRIAASAHSLRSKYGFKTADKVRRRANNDISTINQVS